MGVQNGECVLWNLASCLVLGCATMRLIIEAICGFCFVLWWRLRLSRSRSRICVKWDESDENGKERDCLGRLLFAAQVGIEQSWVAVSTKHVWRESFYSKVVNLSVLSIYYNWSAKYVWHKLRIRSGVKNNINMFLTKSDIVMEWFKLCFLLLLLNYFFISKVSLLIIDTY